MIAAANLAADPRVVAFGRSLTHLEVRSLPSSAPPSARLASFAASQFLQGRAPLAGDCVPTSP